MRRQVALGEFALDARTIIAPQRIDENRIGRPFDRRKVAPRAALVALAAGDHGIERAERLRERLDLAQPAACIGVAPPKRAVAVAARKFRGIRGDAAEIGELEARRERVAIAQGLAEELASVEEE